MTDETDEDVRKRISLLVDEQLDRKEGLKLLARFDSDREAAAVYSRYLLIGEAIRSPGAVVANGSLTRRIHVAIDQEPPMIAPAWQKRKPETLVTAALAATLAAVAILVGRTALQQADLVLPGVPHLAQMSSGPSTPSSDGSSLHNYLVTHNETAYLAANGGLFPSVRVVSHGNAGR